MHFMTRLALAIALIAVCAHPARAQSESAHRDGPNGLEGWTESLPVEGQGELPAVLVIARNHRLLRRIADGPFIWKWMFLPGGKQVAFETGPLHFSLSCELMTLSTGKVTAVVDCLHDLPVNAPDWVRRLENSQDFTANY